MILASSLLIFGFVILWVISGGKKTKGKKLTIQDIKDNWESKGYDYPRKFDKYVEEDSNITS
jgi:hypothetical protein